MRSIDPQLETAVAERPSLRLLERPALAQRQPARRAPPPTTTLWARLERWAGTVLR